MIYSKEVKNQNSSRQLPQGLREPKGKVCGANLRPESAFLSIEAVAEYPKAESFGCGSAFSQNLFKTGTETET